MSWGEAILRRSMSTIHRSHRRVIFAASLGTVFEWYDFYLYGALSAIISRQFFSGVNETTGFIFALLAFAAGFFVRPFGALVFGRLGDLVGRKYTFLITIIIMGSATAIVGMLPKLREHRHRGTDRAGHAAPSAGSRARRRIRRRGDIRCRARAGRAPRALHQLDSNDCHPGSFSIFAGDTRAADHARYRSVRGVGVAHTVPAVDRAARRFGLYPTAAAGIAGVPGDQARGQAVQGAAHRVLRALVQSQNRAARSVRRDCGSGGRLVRRAVLLPVFPGKDSQGRRQRRKSHHCSGADHRYSVLHRVRRAVGPHRPQEGRSWPVACSRR